MSVYLHDIPLVEAISRLETALEEAGLAGVLGVETIELDESCAWPCHGRGGMGKNFFTTLPRLSDGWVCGPFQPN